MNRHDLVEVGGDYFNINQFVRAEEHGSQRVAVWFVNSKIPVVMDMALKDFWDRLITQARKCGGDDD